MRKAGWALAATVLVAVVWVRCTRAAGERREPRGSSVVTLELLASGLEHPVSLAGMDSRLFVVLQRGRIAIVENGRVLSGYFLDLTDRVGWGGERGLLGLAFHPRYRENGFFFVNYTNKKGDTEIVRCRVSASDGDRADPRSCVRLLEIRQPYANHNGGNVLFGPDGYLYIGMGDGGAGGDPECSGQRADTLLGKMLRLDVDRSTEKPPYYAVPPDNPFLARGGAPPEAWAKGLRNPWRFSFDREAHDLYIADVGQNEIEEIDFQPVASRGGENYGWNVQEGRNCFSHACGRAPACGSRELVEPILQYGHDEGDCSVTGGFVYRGQRSPALRGWYFYGDYCTGRLWRARRQDGTWVHELMAAMAPQLTTFGEDREGELYLATLDGNLYHLRGN